MKIRKLQKKFVKALKKNDNLTDEWFEHILGHILDEFVEEEDSKDKEFILTKELIEIHIASGIEKFLDCLIANRKLL